MKYLIALLAVAGIFVSSRALQIHYMDPSQAPPCAVTEKWDCGMVNHGKYSVFPPKTDDEFDDYGQFLGQVRIVLELARVGFFCAAFLSYIEAFVISKWCIYCLWSQCIITAILVASVVAVVMQKRRRAVSTGAVPAESGD
jgi:vitamin-K-epoxide reductase (warfarin-sensitive)